MKDRYRVGMKYEGREDRIWWVGNCRISTEKGDAILMDKEEADSEIDFRKNRHMAEIVVERVA